MSKTKIELNAIKIALLGDNAVGKSSICNSILNIEFKEDLLSTIGIERLNTKFTLKNGKEIKLILFDTAGQERFRSSLLKGIKSIQGIILVFEVTQKITLENFNIWMEEIKKIFNNPPLVLFGNKVDKDEIIWKGNSEELKTFAEKMNIPYFETSAKTGQGIKEGLSLLVNEVYEKYNEKYMEENYNSSINIEEKDIEDKTKCTGKGTNKKK